MRIFLFQVLFYIIFVFLTSCSTNKHQDFQRFGEIKVTDPIKTGDKKTQWIKYQKTHKQLIKGSWILEGYVGVDVSGKGQSARVIWERYPYKYQIDLFGPLGVGSVKIKYKDNIYELIDANGNIYKDKFSNNLLEKVTGFDLPLSGADYWILGMIMPDLKVDSQELNQFGSLKTLSQSGWLISYNNYKVFNGVLMPVSIIFYNSSKDLRIKLIIKRWGFKVY